MLQAAQAARISDEPPGLHLHLSGPELRQLNVAGERALQDARWLKELRLDGIPPAFVFVPR